MNFQKLYVLAFFITASLSFAQKTAIYSQDLNEFDKAVALYNDKQYLAAQIIFEKVNNSQVRFEVKSDAAYYIANCAIRLNQVGADQLIEDFVEKYPTSTKQNQAFIEVAHYYFDQSNYPQALKYFDKVDDNGLTYSDREKFNFQKGYAYFSNKNIKEATNYFNKVLNSKEYGNQAKYYLGYLAYETDDYNKANDYFNKVSDQEQYKEKMGYFQADMNFKLGNFQKAIDLGLAQMSKSKGIEKSELSKIIGESYFNLKQYDKALEYLSDYKGKKGKLNNTDYYQLGYAYYQKKEYENAISQFNKIIDGNDAVAQNAYYHLAECYLNSEKKSQALTAFKIASEMDFDVKIQEDSFLNYAKLSYEIGNAFKSTPEVLQLYLDKYPNSSYKQEINNLLISSYITSKNYKSALVLLEKNKAPENKLAYQMAHFYRGLELYIDGNNNEAYALFNKAISENKDPKFTARALFWKAETEYNLDKFEEAKISFKQFINNSAATATPEIKSFNYNMAYTYFKLKEYDNAIEYFLKYTSTETSDISRLSDAYLRLADCNFISAKYWPAMDAYNKVMELKSPDADYAAYQKGISYGFVGKVERKIEDLNKFLLLFPKSQYADDVLYELGNTYVNQNQNDNAIQIFEKLITNYKSGSYTAKALLKQGLIFNNSGKQELAITKFKKVAADFPKSPEAIAAVDAARLIYIDKSKVEEYAAWVKTLNFVEVTNEDLDNATYESAEKQYLSNNSKGAISGFTTYLSKFPDGLNALNANFYLAQLYFADDLKSNSAKHYEYVIGKSRSEFTEQALARLSEVYITSKNFTEAIPVLIRLEVEADFPQNVLYAQSNLMKSYYEKEDFSNAVVYADKVLAQDKIDDRIKSDAQIIVARSAFKSGNETKAKTAYQNLQKIAKGELAAEALYYEAYFKNKEGKYTDSNKVVEKYSEKYSGYDYFAAKSLLVMAKNYYKLNDSFQATSILDNIIENYQEYNDVVEEAKTELAQIKGEEAQRNSSLQE